MANRTPLHDWHVAHGGRMVEFAGWDMPVQYSGIVEEHQAVRAGVGLFDISHMGRLVLQGPDALALIQHVYTNDAAALKQGQARYGLVCNEQGGILDDVLVYRFDPFWLMVVNASNREKILAWLQQHRGQRRVEVADRTGQWAMIAVQGPRAREVVRATFAAWAWGQDANAGRTFDALKYYFAELYPSPSDGREFGYILSRTGYTGEDGSEIILPAPQAVAVWDELVRRGAKPCGLGARDTLRLEAAMPLYGHELSEEIDPLQAGLGWAVKLDKGEFLGRAALLRRRADPSLRRRVGLELQGKRIAREGAAVHSEGKEVGRVTSGTLAPTLGKPIAMAYVAPALTQPGAELTVDIRGKPEPARVVSLPFYRRAKS